MQQGLVNTRKPGRVGSFWGWPTTVAYLVLVGLGLRYRRRARTPDEPPTEPTPQAEPAGASPTP